MAAQDDKPGTLTSRDDFRAVRNDPETYYQGYEGYKRGETELMESFFAAFPELKGRIVIIDHKALAEDRAAELARVSRELGIDDIEKSLGRKIINAGEAFETTRADGSKVTAITSWNTHKEQQQLGKPLPFETTRAHLSVLSHELAHALDYHLNEELPPQRGMREEHYVESYADGFRTALGVLNGQSPALFAAMIAGYDLRQSNGVTDRYNNGDFLHRVYNTAIRTRNELNPGAAFHDFRLEYWREAKAIIDTVRAEEMAIKSGPAFGEGYLELYDDHHRVIVIKQQELIKASLDKYMPDRDRTKDAGLINEINESLDDLDFAAYKKGNRNPKASAETLRKGEVMYEVRNNLNAWLEQRKDYLLPAGSILAAHNYLHENGIFRDFRHVRFDASTLTGQAFMSYLETGDRLDLEAMKASIGLLPEDEKQAFSEIRSTRNGDMPSYIAAHPEIVDKMRALAEGYINTPESAPAPAIPAPRP